jgi:gamma-glutamyltranspeptidase/glutathione hydrolase
MLRTVLQLAAALAVAAHTPAQGADLSPGHWPAAERGELQTRQLAFAPKTTREVRGAVLVTATASPIAVHAGMEALRQGGSAADAAGVVALTQIVTTMGGTVSYAGKLEAAYFDAQTGTVSFLDASWRPYAGERDPATIPGPGAQPATTELGRQTLVPGFMRGLEALHARFGRLPWAQLFEPSIWYAENGVVASRAILGFHEDNEARFARTPESRAYLRGADGGLPKVGDPVRQPDLADTLRAVARRGASEMYTGAWAHAYVSAVRAYGGRVTLQDLARYRPRWRPPLSSTFAGATVLGMSDGPLACASLTALSLSDAMHVSALGSYWTDPAAFRAYARAIQFATLRQYLHAEGATAFERRAGLPVSSCADRLTRRYAKTLAAELSTPDPHPFGEARLADLGAGHHTMAVVVVDRRGDVAVLVHSTNGEPTGIVVAGVPIPEAATVNKAALAGLRAGDLVPNDIAPLIALRDGHPVAAVGGTATSLMPETVRLMGEMLSGRDGLTAIMAAPPLLYNYAPPDRPDGFSAWPVLTPAGAYPQAFLEQLESKGLAIKQLTPLEAWTRRGEAAAVLIAPSTGATAVELPTLAYFAEGAP